MKNFFSTIVYVGFIRPVLKHIIGVKFVDRRKTFKNIDQCIIVANHNSHFDTVAIMAALPSALRKKTSAVAAGDYFGKTSFTGALMSFFFNAILINRKKSEDPNEESAITTLNRHLKDGQSLVLFPEGSRGKAGVMTDFKNGVGVLLKKNPDVPFIPVYLDGFGRVLPKDASLIIPLVCKVRFGKPIYATSESVEDIVEEIREAIMILKDKDERDRNSFQYE